MAVGAPLMDGEPAEWVATVLSDLNARSPHGIDWALDRAELPLTVRCSLADGPTADFVLSQGLRARIVIVEQIQQFVGAEWEVGIPPCPDHGTALQPVSQGDAVRWQCPAGDIDCAVGDYRELLWPPRTEDDPAPLLGDRWHRRGVFGVVQWSISDGVVQATAREGTNEAALRAAAAPYRVDLTWTGPIGWRRRENSGQRLLELTNGPMLAARLEGRLRRSETGGLLVGDATLHLGFPHRVGPPGRPALLDADGAPFADEGDWVVCAGGFVPSGRVRGAPSVFVAGLIEVSTTSR